MTRWPSTEPGTPQAPCRHLSLTVHLLTLHIVPTKAPSQLQTAPCTRSPWATSSAEKQPRSGRDPGSSHPSWGTRVPEKRMQEGLATSQGRGSSCKSPPGREEQGWQLLPDALPRAQVLPPAPRQATLLLRLLRRPSAPTPLALRSGSHFLPRLVPGPSPPHPSLGHASPQTCHTRSHPGPLLRPTLLLPAAWQYPNMSTVL